MDKTASGMTSWLNLLSVAGGGAVGAVLRYLITLVAAAWPGGSTMLGTTVANVLGCAAIGAFAEYVILTDHVSAHVQLAIRVGLLGGMTTFSTFALESYIAADTGRWQLAFGYVAANLLLGWIALIASTQIIRGWLS